MRITREQEIIKAKLDLFQHRAFWWFIEDLQEQKGPECDIKSFVNVLKFLYHKKLENKDKKWKQGEIPL